MSGLGNAFPKSCRVLDLITKEILEAGSYEEMGKIIGSDRSDVSRLIRGVRAHLQWRFVRPNDYESFVVVDFDTGEEFECVNPRTLFLHLTIPYNINFASRISSLKKRNKTVSFNNRIFYLKGEKPKQTLSKNSDSPSIPESKRDSKNREKVRRILHSRIRYALQGKGLTKNFPTEDLLGCSVDFFIKHIQSKFLPGMTWDNRGSEHINGCRSWHIDHIRPCYTFDLSDLNQQKECFHYLNLRPLWEKDNLSRLRDGSDIGEATDPLLW